MTTRFKSSLIFASVLAGFMAVPSVASACSVPFIRTFDNQVSRGTMTVRSGRPCAIHLRSSSGPMFSVNVVQRPDHGSVRAGGLASVVYQSRAGFVGRDTFTYARQGQTLSGAPSTRTVIVAVYVRP